MTKVTSLARVKGTGEVVEANTDFYNGLMALKEAGAYLITPRHEAKSRMATASSEHIGRDYGTWTTAGFEYAKGSEVLLRLKSRLMNPQLARLAVEANRQGNYFSTATQTIYNETAIQAEKDKNEAPEKRSVLILPSRTDFQITPKTNMEVLNFLLRSPELAKQYFEFNGSVPITTYLVDPKTVDAQDGALMTQLWLCRLGGVDGSDLLGCDRYLGNSLRVRGVRGRQTGEASTQKNVEVFSYTPQHLRVLRNVLHAQGITGELEKRIVNGVKPITK